MSLAHGTSIVKDGLMLHLDAANVKSYPGSGTAWNDVSGNERNCVRNGTTSINQQGITLGTDGYVSLASNNLNTSGSTQVSYSFFINLNWGSIAGYKTIIGIQDTDFSKVATFVLNTGQNELEFDFRDGASIERDIFNESMTVYANKFSQITYTFNLGEHRLYINGKLTSIYTGIATSFPIWSNSAGFAIGENLGSSRLLGSGIFNNILVYSKALSELEVKKNFEALRGRYGI